MKKTIFLTLILGLVGLMFVASCKKEDEKTAAKITYFGFTDPVQAFGVIDDASKTITVNVPYGTDLSNVIGEITLSDANATVSPDITTGIDFTSLSVTFTTSVDGLTQPYTVDVLVGENPLRIALVGVEATIDDIANEEIKTAYQWAMDNYGNKVGYFPFSSLNAENVATAKVIWWHWDSSPREIPADAQGSAKTVITDFYKAGGNLLLTTHASGYLIDLGRITADFGPTGGGDGPDAFENPDNWGISYSKINDENDWYAPNNESHQLFKDCNTSDVTFEGMTYPAIFLIDGGLKRDHSHLWDFNWVPGVIDVVPDPAEPNERKEKFEELTNSVVRASFEWDPAANGVELGTIIEWNPDGAYQGIAITMSLGAYEWYQSDGRQNAWRANIEQMTTNAFTYFGVD